MTIALWIGGILLFAVAAFSVYRAFQSPAFYAAVVQAAAKALAPLFASGADTQARAHKNAREANSGEHPHRPG